jgi:hypothetical protein
MRPSDEEVKLIRQLHADGHSVEAISESFHMSRRWVRELVTSPATPEQLEAVERARAELEEEAEVASDATSFAGFAGEQAEFVAGWSTRPSRTEATRTLTGRGTHDDTLEAHPSSGRWDPDHAGPRATCRSRSRDPDLASALEVPAPSFDVGLVAHTTATVGTLTDAENPRDVPRRLTDLTSNVAHGRHRKDRTTLKSEHLSDLFPLDPISAEESFTLIERACNVPKWDRAMVAGLLEGLVANGLVVQDGDPNQRTYRRAAPGAPEAVQEAARSLKAPQRFEAPAADNPGRAGFDAAVSSAVYSILRAEGLLGGHDEPR